MRPRSLRARLAGYFVLAMVVALAGMGLAAYVVVAHEFRSALDTGLRREATRIGRQFAAEPDVATFSGSCRYLAAPSCVQVVAADGRIESARDPEDTPLPIDDETRTAATGTEPAYFSDSIVDGYPMRVYTTQLRPGTALQVAQRSDPVDKALRRVGLALLAAAAAGTVLAIAVGVVVARRALAPVTALTRAAQRVATTRDPRRHITVAGSDELAVLARSFNIMLDELDQALTAERDSRAAQRRLVADASHELRTPLTVLRTNIDLLRRADRLTPQQLAATADALRLPAAELSGLVTDLIDLARAEDPEAATEPFEDLRLDALVTACVQTAESHWPAVIFETDAEPTTIRGAPARLTRAITNLLDNAAKFSPPGAAVHVELRDNRLTVRDRGPGIDPEDLPHVFDRFYRSRTARRTPGHGLGLAIVMQVAALHGARVQAANPSDGGALFSIEFGSAPI
ncbi:HAMP domain-containing sensor histidine kinase [Nocardia mexicana]|uniref:histidine kinase n=1 Tax=Nocardia mexicana TaxID=279262 RepID=A0A370HEW5_9NOCA|nr:HAMP domain-containing sensor histidine kinase [Nocardia mexicana]RDI53423.1 two-component system sensor histidine kinase MprB [Nocardia mexicana]